MWRSVALVRTDGLDESIASIIRVEGIPHSHRREATVHSYGGLWGVGMQLCVQWGLCRKCNNIIGSFNSVSYELFTTADERG
jgi:hypothetical protein